ncbi:redox-regulated ATPase YchF [Helicobacter sp. MIT 14-3879]|uniref:redox-regulated ATPase YchF n=1 Tax=Helicobacter sp. MIT 14-3879 TaxID=2040649 RepID=UPI000E1F728F|nr:redox-regulated ATPase YchF [Helicobacter sp. MIT 14-3879]RDU64177.1 redox-regulated ATPase YchF [Helicobacter sp. MIT 14-3879]
MGLSVGIVGLPNVGKSTTFNALTKTQKAQAANYPFCTIEPNRAIIQVPDSRIDELAKIVNPKKIQFSTIEFVDIAGLVRGASKGEGLGNQFLANIKEVDAILHIVRCFEDSNITHIEREINPINDIEIIELELLFSDLQTLEKRIDRLNRSAKASKDSAKILSCAMTLKEHLEQNKPVKTFKNKDSDEFRNLDKELRFLSNKEVIYCANVSEDFESKYLDSLIQYASKNNSKVIVICAKLEEEMIDMSDEEKKEFLLSIGVEKSGLEQIIKTSFETLNLISYFTAGVKEVRSWTINKGTKAPKAAAIIHNDFEKGFIRAETISYTDFIKYNGELGAKEAGAMRSEGKDYIVQDGDILHFRFNV